MNVYPAAIAIGTDVWDGLQVSTDHAGALIARSKHGAIYLNMAPWAARPALELGPQGAVVHGVDDDRGGEQTILVWQTSGCGCGGPLHGTVTAEQAALMASWEPDDALPV